MLRCCTDNAIDAHTLNSFETAQATNGEKKYALYGYLIERERIKFVQEKSSNAQNRNESRSQAGSTLALDSSMPRVMVDKDNLTVEEPPPCSSLAEGSSRAMASPMELLFHGRPRDVFASLAGQENIRLHSDLARRCLIKTCGCDGSRGDDGERGRNGTGCGGYGSSGSRGHDGRPGTNAWPNIAALTSVAGQDLFVVSSKEESIANSHLMRLGDGNINVNLHAFVSNTILDRLQLFVYVYRDATMM
jgi:hypothetical protein